MAPRTRAWIAVGLLIGATGCSDANVAGWKPPMCPSESATAHAATASPVPTALSKTSPPRAAPRRKPFLPARQRQRVRHLALTSPVVNRIVGDVPVVAGRLIEDSEPDNCHLHPVFVVLKAQRPVLIPVGVPIPRSYGEDGAPSGTRPKDQIQPNPMPRGPFRTFQVEIDIHSGRTRLVSFGSEGPAGLPCIRPSTAAEAAVCDAVTSEGR